MNDFTLNKVAGVALAGGNSERMSRLDKLYLPFDGEPLLSRTLSYLESQVSVVVINCNNSSKIPSDLSRFPLVKDKELGEAGPLDGLVSTMEWLACHHPQVQWLMSVPVDCPFLPADLFNKLSSAIRQNPETQLALASCGNKSHYTCALWSTNLATEGRDFLNAGKRALKHFISGLPSLLVNYPLNGIDPFFNINSPKDYQNALAQLEKTNTYDSQQK